MDLSQILPIPDVMQAKRVIAFSPHPDDNEMGAGGTLAKLAQTGTEILWAVASDGSVGTEDNATSTNSLAAVRRQEQEDAVRLLGGYGVEWMGFTDTHLRDNPQSLEFKVVKLIRSYHPDFVFCPDPWLPYEAHPDHRTLGHAVSTALLMVNFPLAYPETGAAVTAPSIAYYGSAWPNTTVDISDTFQRKLEALMAHKSQFIPPFDQQIQMYLTLQAVSLGESIGVARGEAFKVLTHHHLHFNVDAWKS
ncbi:MAG: PIG-L family deacetylase [Firmicutes bacterium]|nr:PIG-L family deacetylase [Bacillota bacterium]